MFMCLAYFLSIVNNSNNKDLNYYIAKYIIEKDIIEEKWNEIHIFAWIGASSFGLGGYN